MGFLTLSVSQNINEFACLSDNAEIIFDMSASSLRLQIIFCFCLEDRSPSGKRYASSDIRMGFLTLSISQNIDEFACLSDNAEIIFSMSASLLRLQIIFCFCLKGRSPSVKRYASSNVQMGFKFELKSEREALCQLRYSD